MYSLGCGDRRRPTTRVRAGRGVGQDFYDYVDGRRVGMWPGLRSTFDTAPVPGVSEPPADLTEHVDRFVVAQVLEAQRCVDEGVFTDDAMVNVGALLGIGFSDWPGGP